MAAGGTVRLRRARRRQDPGGQLGARCCGGRTRCSHSLTARAPCSNLTGLLLLGRPRRLRSEWLGGGAGPGARRPPCPLGTRVKGGKDCWWRCLGEGGAVLGDSASSKGNTPVHRDGPGSGGARE